MNITKESINIGNHKINELVTIWTSAKSRTYMGKHVWGARPRVNFILKKPSETDGRKTFQVLKRITVQGQKPTHEKVDDERIRTLNTALLAGSLGLDQCRMQAEIVIESMLAKEKSRLPKAVFNEENRRALEDYWESEYAHRALVRTQEARDRLKRAIEAVGSGSLYTATRSQLQTAINAKYPDHRQRPIVSSLNPILKYIGRDFKLTKRKETRKEVDHLTPEEFKKAQRFVADPIDRLIQRVGFNTGLRQGEIFALTLQEIQGARVFSQWQMDRELDRRETKTKEETRRRVYVLPGGMDAVLEWAKLPTKIKKEWRNRRHAEILTEACIRAFPDQTEKHCTFHALRHSFAIVLATKGVSLTQIAKCLNNSVLVCERYYTGFTAQDETIEAIDRMMNASVAKLVDASDLKSEDP
jgi:integrase